MENSLTEAEDLEPLFDYSRVQPLKFINIDDVESSPVQSKKRRNDSRSVVEKKVKVDRKEVEVLNCDVEEEEDWLPPPPPPPKVLVENQLGEDSAFKELRLKKQELASFAKAAENMLRDVEESEKRKLFGPLEASIDGVADQLSKPPCERAKIVISIQDKEGLKQFRVFMDDKFERLFKMYADKVKLDTKNLVFCFDGDKIGPASTPASLGMEDDDIIEVHVKS